jgi:hypothetical protein
LAKISEKIEGLTLNDIISFCETGNPNNAPDGISEYLELLDKTRGMIDRFDHYPNDNIIINALMLTDGLSRYKARIIVDEAREFFYRDSKVSVKAWGNYYADLIDKTAKFAMLVIKDVKDGLAVVKMLETAYKVRGGGEEVKEELPAELFQPQWVVYTTDAEELGLPKVDRNRIKEFIDKRVPELSEKEKNRLYQEADIIPFKALQNDEENPRKD